MAKTIDTLGVEVTAIDNHTATMARVQRSTEDTTKSFARFQNQAGQRVEMASARMAQGAIMDLTGAVPGLSSVVMAFSSTIMKAMGALGAIGWVLAGVTLAVTTLKKILDGAAESKRRLAEQAGTLASAYTQLATEMDAASASNIKYLETALALYTQQLQQLNIEKSVLEGKQFRKRLNDEESLKLLELQMRYEKTAIAINKVRDALYGWTAAEKAKAEIAKGAADMAAMEAEVQNVMLELFRAAEYEKMSIREQAFTKAGEEYSKLTERLKTAASAGVNVVAAQETLQLAIKKRAADIEMKMMADKNRGLAENWVMTARYMATVSERLAAGEKLTFENVAKEYMVVWLDAIQKRLEAEMQLAVAQAFLTGNWLAVASYAAGITAVGAMRGALKASMKATETILPGMPEYGDITSGLKTDLGRDIERAEKVGGRSISTAHQQIVNYVTVSPRYQLLDGSQITEARAKEIAEWIGKYLQEGTSAGSVGLS